jgi:hypothetical protein
MFQKLRITDQDQAKRHVRARSARTHPRRVRSRWAFGSDPDPVIREEQRKVLI